MLLFGIISGVFIFIILFFVLLLNFANSAPRVKLEENDVEDYNYDSKPNSVIISYEWSETMNGFGDNLNEISSILFQTANQISDKRKTYKFTDGYPGEISAFADAEEMYADSSQILAMLDNDDDSELKIYITAMTDKQVDMGSISAQTAKKVFDNNSKALGVLSVNSEFCGNVITNQGKIYSEKKRPFFILIAGENVKVSYFMENFLEYSKIRDLNDSGEFNCEIFAEKCGVAGIDYTNIKQYNGNENEIAAALNFEELSKVSPEEATLDDLNKIRSSVNIKEKKSIVKAKIYSLSLLMS